MNDWCPKCGTYQTEYVRNVPRDSRRQVVSPGTYAEGYAAGYRSGVEAMRDAARDGTRWRMVRKDRYADYEPITDRTSNWILLPDILDVADRLLEEKP